MSREKIKKIVIFLLLFILAICFMVPPYTIVVTSLKSVKEIMTRGVWALPTKPEFKSFVTAWIHGRMNISFINSLIVSLCGEVLAIFAGSLAAYSLGRLRFKGNFPIFILLITGMFFPPQIFMTPLYNLFNFLKLYDTLFAQIITHGAFGICMSTLILRNFFRTIPTEIQDAAIMDGASHFTIYSRIILPLAKPSLAVLIIILFSGNWNNFLWGLILSKSKAIPVLVNLMNLRGEYAIVWNVQAAGTLLVSLPVIIVFLVFQRYFIKGLLMGIGK